MKLPAGVGNEQAEQRLKLWQALEDGYLAERPGGSGDAHALVYRRASRLMHSQAAAAFELEREPAEVRDAYGLGRFGQGCLLARRLVERGVPFVEITLGGIDGNAVGWDTHQNNFPAVRSLSGELDAGFATLLAELKDRGLLATTTILWMGEFGRTPTINNNGGRDHFPGAWSAVLAGGGIHGGMVHGSTSPDGMIVADNPASAADLIATLVTALGIKPETQNTTGLGRPIKISEGTPIRAVLN